MLIYLYGQDAYLRQRKAKELLKAYRAKYAQVDLFIADLGEEPDDWRRVKEFLGQPSLFAVSKIALVREGGAVGDAGWVKAVRGEKETSKTFVIISDCDGPKKAFHFLLEPPVKTQEFAELHGDALMRFVKMEAAERKVSFTPEALALFLQYLLNGRERSGRAVHELEKLSLAGFPQPISLNDLKVVISPAAQEQVFAVSRTILKESGVEKKLSLLERLLIQGEAGAYLFNTLAYQAIGRQALRLADYDIAVKSGKLEYEETLLGFIISEQDETFAHLLQGFG